MGIKDNPNLFLNDTERRSFNETEKQWIIDKTYLCHDLGLYRVLQGRGKAGDVHLEGRPEGREGRGTRKAGGRPFVRKAGDVHL